MEILYFLLTLKTSSTMHAEHDESIQKEHKL
jgi:hypothetical protein